MKHPSIIKIFFDKKKQCSLLYKCTGIIFISQSCFLIIIYLYRLKVVVVSIAIVQPTGQQANMNSHMFTHFILMRETLFHMT